MVSDDVLLRAQGRQLGLLYWKELPDGEFDVSLMHRVPLAFARQHKLVPIRMQDGAALVAVSQALALQPLDDVGLLLKAPVEPVLSSEREIIGALNRFYDTGSQTADKVIQNLDDETLGRLAHAPGRAAGHPRSRGRGAHHPARQPDLVAGGARPRQRHPHRAVRAGAQGALPHRRRAARGAVAAQGAAAAHHLAAQGHGRPEHRRDAAAAGRQDRHPGAQPRDRHSRLGGADGLRRTPGAAPAGQVGRPVSARRKSACRRNCCRCTGG